MKLKTLIIDDEPLASLTLRNYVEKTPFLELMAECQSGMDALEYLSKNTADLIFTDIDLPDINGMELMSSITSSPLIVFATAHPEYAVESYRLSAVDYLLKPYRYIDFHRAAVKALDIFNSRNKQGADPSASIFIKVDSRFVRVALSSIIYIKGYGEYLQIFIDGEDAPLLTLSSFLAIKQKLSGNFIQVHRSYIVNMDRIDQVSRNRIVIGEDTYIPVSDTYKADFHNYITNHSVGKIHLK